VPSLLGCLLYDLDRIILTNDLVNDLLTYLQVFCCLEIKLLHVKNKTSTIIKEFNNNQIIFIKTDQCKIEGFTIKGNDTYFYMIGGINISSSNNIIQNNQNIGIISVIGGSNFTIAGNIIAKNGGSGIALGGTINSKNNIVRNIVTDNNHYGIWVLGNLNYITENTVQNHKTPRLILRFAAGITIQGKDNIITRNNLINNSRQQAYQKVDGINRTEIFNIIKENNFWDGNYWGEPLTEPKRIVGRILINAFLNLGFLWLPWTAYDEHPAKEPYDIPEMS
jgi:hypothetical protein